MAPLLLELTVLLCIALALDVSHRDVAVRMRRHYVGIALACGVWSVGNLAQRHGLLGPVGADRITYLGVLTLPALWLGLAAQVQGLDLARRAPWFPLLLMAPQLALYGLLWSGPWAGLFIVPVSRDLVPGGLAPGPLWWINAVYSWLLAVAGSGLLLLGALSTRTRRAPLRRLGLVLASCAPLVANLGYVAGGMTWSPDPTPVALGLALIALRGAVFSRAFFAGMPISQHDLVRQIPTPLLLVDRQGTVVAANPSAGLRLGLSPDHALWRGLDEVLLDAGYDQQPELWPVVSSGREVGQIVLLEATPKPAARGHREAS